MTTIKIETETIETDLTPSEAAAKIKEALAIAEWPQIGDEYWVAGFDGIDVKTKWDNDILDQHRLAHGNCSPTQEGLAGYKADMAKYAAIVAIRKHRDKTFGVFEPKEEEWSAYGVYTEGKWTWNGTHGILGGIAVPFRATNHIAQSFTECGEHWEVLK